VKDSWAIVCWAALGVLACVSAVIFLLMRSRLQRARKAERLAVERRDRFFAIAARELAVPLATLRDDLAGLDAWGATPARIGALVDQVDQLRAVVSELGRLPAPVPAEERSEVDLSELVRDIVAQPPFSDRGPSVILRAAPTTVFGDRARLMTGFRVLLWVVRRDLADNASLVVTVSSDGEAARVEIDSGGGGGVADVLERLPAVAYGLASASGPGGTLLALQVAQQVARVHGGRLTASARVGKGERFMLELPIVRH
jgi:signal transduction histidine kinase